MKKIIADSDEAYRNVIDAVPKELLHSMDPGNRCVVIRHVRFWRMHYTSDGEMRQKYKEVEWLANPDTMSIQDALELVGDVKDDVSIRHISAEAELDGDKVLLLACQKLLKWLADSQL